MSQYRLAAMLQQRSSENLRQLFLGKCKKTLSTHTMMSSRCSAGLWSGGFTGQIPYAYFRKKPPKLFNMRATPNVVHTIRFFPSDLVTKMRKKMQIFMFLYSSWFRNFRLIPEDILHHCRYRGVLSGARHTFLSRINITLFLFESWCLLATHNFKI